MRIYIILCIQASMRTACKSVINQLLCMSYKTGFILGLKMMLNGEHENISNSFSLITIVYVVQKVNGPNESRHYNKLKTKLATRQKHPLQRKKESHIYFLC